MATNAKLTEEQAKEAINLLKRDGTTTFTDIGKKYNVDRKVISGIYNKESWINLTNGITFAKREEKAPPMTQELIDKIVNTFLTTSKNDSEIARIFNLSPNAIRRLRNRERHADKIDPSLDLHKNIRRSNGAITGSRLSDDIVEDICKELSTSNAINFTHIGNKYGTNRKTVASIYNGTSYKHIASKYNFNKKVGKYDNKNDYIGRTYNNLKLLDILDEKDKYSNTLGKFKCTCGNTTIKPINVVERGKIKSCGCMSNRNYVEKKSKDDPNYNKEEYHRIIDIWRKMIARCYQSGDLEHDHPEIYSVPELRNLLDKDKEQPRYYDYGARGIKVNKKWMLDRYEFYKWYRDNIKPGESMDRINNNGPYTPSNLRSADNKIQIINQRKRRDNTSGYKGVISVSDVSYRWYIKNNGIKYGKEGFKSPHMALIERNIFIVQNNFPHNIQHIVHDRAPRMVQVIYDNSVKGYRIMFVEHGVPVVAHVSTTWFKTKGDPILVKVVKEMNSFKSK